MDQAAKLRQLFKSKDDFNKDLGMNSRVITITSGKGGVGKSNFVINMGITLQKMGKKVLIFDADIGMGNDDVLMGMVSRHNIYDFIKNDLSIEEVIMHGPEGINLLPGGSGLMNVEDLTESERERFLEKLSQITGYDYILIDTGAGISRSVLAFIACAEELIVVTTPEPTSMTDAYSLLKAVNHYKIKNKASLVVNRIFSIEEGNKTFNKMEKVVSTFLNIDLRNIGFISDDKELVKSVRAQKPVVLRAPKSESARDLRKIAERIDGIEKTEIKNDMKGFFKKMFNLFS